MPPQTDDAARAAALDFARDLAAFGQDRYGSGLLGFYLIGSLAHGGFNRRYSDIDLAIVARDGIAEAMVEAVREQAARLSPELASKLSLFWTDPEFSIGRFPPLDRLDYLDHGVALTESKRAEPDRPSRDEVRAYLRGAPFARWEESVAGFAGLEGLDAASRKPYLRALLYPARFVHSWVSGGVASNDEAVRFLCESRPPGIDTKLMERALECRQEASDPDFLFAERKSLRTQVEACRRLMR